MTHLVWAAVVAYLGTAALWLVWRLRGGGEAAVLREEMAELRRQQAGTEARSLAASRVADSVASDVAELKAHREKEGLRKLGGGR